MIRVLLVDDQSMLRLGFRLILDAEDGIEVVGEAGDGATAVSMSAALRPDVVLMDVRMPGMDGIAATAAIVAAHPDNRVLILTTFDLDEYVLAGLRAGASGLTEQPLELRRRLAHAEQAPDRPTHRQSRWITPPAARVVRPGTSATVPAAARGRSPAGT